jgi:hypothetical protein
MGLLRTPADNHNVVFYEDADAGRGPDARELAKEGADATVMKRDVSGMFRTS